MNRAAHAPAAGIDRPPSPDAAGPTGAVGLATLTDARLAVSAGCTAAGRDPATVELLAAHKGMSDLTVLSTLGEGHLMHAENRVAEAAARWPALSRRFPDVQVHLTGRFGRKHIDTVARLFHTVHTITDLTVAGMLARHCDQQAVRCPAMFLQVNATDAAHHPGLHPARVGALADTARSALSLPVIGLMAVTADAPNDERVFETLRELGDRYGLPHLCMGMTTNFVQAISYGATHVRVRYRPPG